MTIQSFPAGVWIPRPLLGTATPSLTFYASVTNAAGKVAWIIQAPKAGNIRKVVWGTRTVTTGATVDVRLETVDATVTPAVPSGTLVGTNTNGSQVVAGTDDNVTFTTTLTSDATVTMGQLFAVVIANASPGSMSIPTCLSESVAAFPYMAVFNGTSWSTSTTGVMPMLSLEYSDGSYAPIQGVYPASATLTANAINTTTTPDVYGLRFQFPFPARVRGAWAVLSGAGDYTVRLVTSAYNQGTLSGVLATATFDKDVRGVTPQLYTFTFDSAVSLSKTTNYRLIVSPSTTTSLTVIDISLVTAAQMNAWEGGSNFMLTSAKDPTQDSDWTNYNSGTFREPLMGLLLDGFDDGTSAGGGASNHVFVG